MQIKRPFIIGISLIIATITTTSDCAKDENLYLFYQNKRTEFGNKIPGIFGKFINDKIIIIGGTGKFKRAKASVTNALTSVLNMSQNTHKNWKTSSYSRKFNKVIGQAPIVRENDINKLKELISNEADFIKIGAFRKLNKLSSSTPSTDYKEKKRLIYAQLHGTIELIKFYGTVYNCPMVKITFAQGLYYAYSCVKMNPKSSSECLRLKSLLLAAFIFSYKVEINRVMRFFLNRTMKEADKHLKDDKTLKFIDTQIACEIKLMQDNKNKFLKAGLRLYMGSSNKKLGYNCVTELLPFENDLKEVDSYPGEYHYLLARAYAQQNNNVKALEHLRTARNADVVDSKTRHTNKKVQQFYEKIYTRMNAVI